MSNEVFKNYVAAAQLYKEVNAAYCKASDRLSAAHDAVRNAVKTHEERAVVVGDDVVIVKGDSIRIVPLLAL